MSRIIRCCCAVLFCLTLAACALPSTVAGPPPTPTPRLAPYNAAIATAEAGGDAAAQAAAYYERGNQQFDMGDYPAALADYDRAVELDPTHSRAFNNRGLVHATLGNVTEALADYTSAIRLDPAYVRAHKNRLRLLEQYGSTIAGTEEMLRETAQGYGQLAELEPDSRAEYRYQQGSLLYRLRDYAGARQAFDAALAADPRQVDALYERALLNLTEGKPDAALADLNAAIQLSPRAANAYYARGLVHAGMGDQARAIADFSSALDLRVDYAEALLGRALAYQASGDIPAARADLDRLAELPLDETLETARETLRRQLEE